jgi:hypothetical protein
MATTKWVLDLPDPRAFIEHLCRPYEEFRKCIAAAETAREQFQALLNPPVRDPWRLLSRRYSRAQRFATARAVAARMSTRFKNPEVVAALCQRRGADRWLHEEVFPQALLLAAAERHKAQRIRLGKRWVNGSHRPVVPMQLGWPNTVRWLKQHARRLAEEIILEAAPRVRRLSPRERELVLHLQTRAMPLSVVAEEMGIDPSTLRTMAHRLVRKGAKVQ